MNWVTIFYSGYLPDPGIELVSLVSPALAGGFFANEPLGEELYANDFINRLAEPRVRWENYNPVFLGAEKTKGTL